MDTRIHSFVYMDGQLCLSLSLIYFSLGLSAQRYIYICRPHLSKRWCSFQISSTGILLAFIFAVVHLVPRAFDRKYLIGAAKLNLVHTFYPFFQNLRRCALLKWQRGFTQSLQIFTSTAFSGFVLFLFSVSLVCSLQSSMSTFSMHSRAHKEFRRNFLKAQQ